MNEEEMKEGAILDSFMCEIIELIDKYCDLNIDHFKLSVIVMYVLERGFIDPFMNKKITYEEIISAMNHSLRQGLKLMDEEIKRIQEDDGNLETSTST